MYLTALLGLAIVVFASHQRRFGNPDSIKSRHALALRCSRPLRMWSDRMSYKTSHARCPILRVCGPFLQQMSFHPAVSGAEGIRGTRLRHAKPLGLELIGV
jgi:hypothetical protein